MFRNKIRLITGLSVLTIAGVTIFGFSFFNNFNADASESKYSNYPAEKRTILENEERKHLLGIKEKKTKIDNGGPIIIQHDKKLKTKILDVVDDPLSKKAINFTNGWRSEINGQMKGGSVVIGVGALTDHPKQGVVLVRVFKEETGLLSTEKYLTPTEHGAVKVVDYNGFQLELESEDGIKWRFNVPSGKFVESH